MALANEGQASEVPEVPQPRRQPLKEPQALKPQWFRYLVSPETQQPTLLGHAAIAGSFFAVVAVVMLGLMGYASQKQNDWLNFDNFSRSEEELQALVKDVNATPAEKARMADQFIQVQRRIEVHSEVMSLFYKLNFISLGTITLTLGVASISLFFISKLGWDRVNNAVINLFILTSGFAVFHSNLILIFKYQENVQINQKLYTDYSSLRNTILSYWATQPSTKNSLPPAEFIYQIDGKLAELGMVTLDFDTEKAASQVKPIEYLPNAKKGGTP